MARTVFTPVHAKLKRAIPGIAPVLHYMPVSPIKMARLQ